MKKTGIICGFVFLAALFVCILASPILISCGRVVRNNEPVPPARFQLWQSTPSANATSVETNTIIRAVFSKPLNTSSVNSSTFRVYSNLGTVEGTITFTASTTVVFTPTTLATNLAYTIGLDASILDIYGHGLNSPYSWTFTTGNSYNTTPLSILSTDPENEETNIYATRKSITATFNKPVIPETVTTSGTFTVGTLAGSLVSGEVTYEASTNTVFFTPNVNLPAHSWMVATIEAGVKDYFKYHLEDPVTWLFKTTGETDAPYVVSNMPISNETNVPITAEISATFNKAMRTLSLTTTGSLTVFNATNHTALSASEIYVNYEGTKVVYNYDYTLSYESTYIATVSAFAQDTYGNSLGHPYTWSFTTVRDLRPSAWIAPKTPYYTNETTSIITGLVTDLATSISAIDYRVNGGTWHSVTSRTQVSSSPTTETFSATIPSIITGIYTIEVRATDSNGLVTPSTKFGNTRYEVNQTLLHVSTVSPAASSVQVDTDSKLTFIFNHKVDVDTLPDGIKLMLGETTIEGTWTPAYDSAIVTFEPTSTLIPSTEYERRVFSKLLDIYGNTYEVSGGGYGLYTFTTRSPWKRLTSYIGGGGPIFSLFFEDENTGWVLPEAYYFYLGSNAIYKTTDGGESWTTQYFPVPSGITPKKVYFTDKQNGWVLGQYIDTRYKCMVSRTTDGGDSWQTAENLVPSSGGAYPAGITFTNSREGYIYGTKDSTPFLYKSTDGGETWAPAGLTDTDYNYAYLDMHMYNDSTGVLLKQSMDNYPHPTQPTLVLYTTDGWETATSTTVAPNDCYASAIYLSGDRKAWTCGTNHTGITVEYSSDVRPGSPAAWQYMKVDWLEYPGDVAFTDMSIFGPNEGWAVGEGTKIIHSAHVTDINTAWSQEATPIGVTGDFTCVQFKSTNVGYVGSDQGQLLKY